MFTLTLINTKVNLTSNALNFKIKQIQFSFNFPQLIKFKVKQVKLL